MRGIWRRLSTTSNSSRLEAMTIAKQSSSTDSTRSQSCCAGAGSGRCNRPNARCISK